MKNKRKIYQNIYGNYRGYIGRKSFFEFGTDEVSAGHWLLTGNADFYSGYESNETIEAANGT